MVRSWKDSIPRGAPYRWMYGALHTLDFPALVAQPRWRTLLITLLCALGFVFSSTALVIGWRRVSRKARLDVRQAGVRKAPSP